jgi:6-pyruvoyl-tetrahydropterin synthase related domain
MRDPEREDLVEKGDIWDWIPTLIAFLIIYTVLLIFYRPNLLFSLTTTSGGDTGAHHYPAQYLIQELLPHFKLTGWAPGWYAGMPMLTFYFPFPFLLIAIFNWILPYQIAFKIVTVLGVFALPWAAYAFGRLLRVRRPFPVLAAVFAFVMLFMESYSIYGGNILSTLAGEFGYMLSFALVFLFLGTAYRGMEKPRFNMLFVLNCLILMALVLSHIVPTIALVFIAPGLLLVNPRWRSLGYLVVVAAVGFALTAFWSLPFAANLQWTAHMAWNQLGWKDFLPTALYPIAFLGFVGMAFAVAKRESKLLPLAWLTFIVAVVYWVLPDGRLWNARIIPFFYFSLHLWAAYGTTWLIRPFTVVAHDLFRTRGITARRAYVPVVALVLGIVILLVSHTAASWIKWNYTGYEGRQYWTEYQQINNYIATLPPGRVMVEHNQKIDELGTPRAFEIIPYWTGQPTMEGTLMEASFTAPFHFINQAELSQQASDAIIGIKYPSFDVANGITHLQLMNIPYFLTCTEETTAATKADPRAELLATFGGYNIFRISGTTGYAEVMKNQPVRVDVAQSDWTNMAVDWYKNMDDLQTPIVWDTGDSALQQFPSITPDQATNPPVVPIQTEGHVTGENMQNESFSFDVDGAAIGQPVWIKISYFPNWHVEGAKGPYLASPSFMMVIPTQSHVTLTYGRTSANTVGQILEVIAWIILVALAVWRTILWRRRRRLVGAGRGSAVIPVHDYTDRYFDHPEQRYDAATGTWVTADATGDAAGRDDLEVPEEADAIWGGQPVDEAIDESPTGETDGADLDAYDRPVDGA